MKIRKFSHKDWGQVSEISRVSFAEPWPQREFEKYLDGLFVAEDNAMPTGRQGEIVGFVIGKISGNQGTLKLVAVSRNYRGKGVGKSLMEYIFKYFAEKKVKEVMAHSRLHNEAGCAFLKSFDFEIIETVE